MLENRPAVAGDGCSAGRVDLKPRWRKRFEFFDAHGPPKSAEYRDAFRGLGLGERARISLNLLAFIFGPFYFLALGLWRCALTFLGLAAVTVALEVAIEAAVGALPDWYYLAVGYGFAGMFAVTANHAYYLKRVKGRRTWNPFEGLGWR